MLTYKQYNIWFPQSLFLFIPVNQVNVNEQFNFLIMLNIRELWSNLIGQVLNSDLTANIKIETEFGLHLRPCIKRSINFWFKNRI